MRPERVAGFQTGNMVRAVIRAGKKAGTYLIRVAIRASNHFNIQTADGVVKGVNAERCKLLAHGDGYGHVLTRKLLSSSPMKQGYLGA